MIKIISYEEVTAKGVAEKLEKDVNEFRDNHKVDSITWLQSAYAGQRGGGPYSSGGSGVVLTAVIEWDNSTE